MMSLFHHLCRFEPEDAEGRARYWRREFHNLMEHGRPKPTKRQGDCLQIIKDYIEQEGQPPTYREIAAKMGATTAPGIACFIQGLEERGYIKRIPGKMRSIEVIEFTSHNNA